MATPSDCVSPLARVPQPCSPPRPRPRSIAVTPRAHAPQWAPATSSTPRCLPADCWRSFPTRWSVSPDSTYRQEQRIRLDLGASLVLVDWVSAGRHATGERWQCDGYSSRLAVHQNGRLTLLDSIALDGPDLVSRMGRFNILCLVIMAGPAVASHAANALSTVSSLPIEPRASTPDRRLEDRRRRLHHPAGRHVVRGGCRRRPQLPALHPCTARG